MEDEVFYTIPEAAEKLKVTPQAIYKWMRQGRIKPVYVGSDRRITGSALRAFVEESTKQRTGEDATIDSEIGIPGQTAIIQLASV